MCAMLDQLDPFSALVLFAVVWAAGLWVAYLVIRIAVRHAIEDADRRRSGGGK
jgi:hypothetical protein